MRRFLIGLVVALLLAVSIAIGITVARWPQLSRSGQTQHPPVTPR